MSLFRTGCLITTCALAVFGLNCASHLSRELAHEREDRNEGLSAFAYVLKVTVSSARCINCHVSGDHPMQLEGAARRIHPMNVQRKLVNLGLQCTSCHGTRNFDEEHLPPGTLLRGEPHWGMPSAHKAFSQNTSAVELCQLWKDPRRNEFENDDPETGRKANEPRTPEDLLAHVTNDPLVTWTWSPGPGRTPSSGTHEEFVKNFAVWVGNGAPCPDESK